MVGLPQATRPRRRHEADPLRLLYRQLLDFDLDATGGKSDHEVVQVRGNVREEEIAEVTDGGGAKALWSINARFSLRKVVQSDDQARNRPPWLTDPLSPAIDGHEDIFCLVDDRNILFSTCPATK